MKLNDNAINKENMIKKQIYDKMAKFMEKYSEDINFKQNDSKNINIKGQRLKRIEFQTFNPFMAYITLKSSFLFLKLYGFLF